MGGKNTEISKHLEAYPYQIAGHVNQEPLKVTADGCVLKQVQRPPKGEREVVFYETVFDKKEEREEILQLRRFLPFYYGVVELDSSRYLKLENITIKFRLPCVIDIKVGKVTWEDDVEESFKERRKKKWPLRNVAGFSILGYMVYDHKTCCYERCMRDYCMKLATMEDAERTFYKFLASNNKEWTQHILVQLMAKLAEIEQWFKTQRLYRFIASSILISYEADWQNVASNCSASSNNRTASVACQDHSFTESMTDSNVSLQLPLTNYQQLPQVNKTLVDARIIDTAHVFTTSDIDRNYLFGLENIISIVKCIQTHFT